MYIYYLIGLVTFCWTAQAACPTNDPWVADNSGTRCYLFVDAIINIIEDSYSARNHCLGLGGDLVSLDDSTVKTNFYIWLQSNQQSSSKIAIGLYRESSNSAVWVNNATFSGTFNDPFDDLQCVYSQKTGAVWDTSATLHNTDCCFQGTTFDVVCERPMSSPVRVLKENNIHHTRCFGNCTAGWYKLGDQCYKNVPVNDANDASGPLSVYTAHERCQMSSATLPAVSSVIIEQHLINIMKKNALTTLVDGFYLANHDAFNETDFLSAKNVYITYQSGSVSGTNNNLTNCMMTKLSKSGSALIANGWQHHDCCDTNSTVYLFCQKPEDWKQSAIITNKDLDGISYDCFKDIDECISSPCENNATCQDRIKGYTCNCPQHYEGSTCGQEINYCTKNGNPCVNDGLCNATFGGYNCSCDPRFRGDTCDKLWSVCASNPCQNGATCADLPANLNSSTSTYTLSDTSVQYICHCPLGYNGTHCENDIDECVGVSCNGHGSCIDKVGTYECKCHHSYTGKDCEREIKCLLTDLPADNSIGNTTTSPASGTRQDDTKVFTCISGMKFADMSTTKTLTCTEQSWVPDLKAGCSAHCDILPAIDNTVVLENNTAVGFTANYSCVRGYRFPDNSTSFNMTCLPSRQWDKDVQSIQQCEIVQCPPLPIYDHQTLGTTDRDYNQTVVFWCDVGYTLHDNTTARTIKCLWTGRWTATLPKCLPVRCPKIITPLNSVRNTSESNNDYNIYNSYIEYKCNSGMRMLDGATYRIIRCDATGQWSDNVTECATNRCYPLPYVANARPNELNATFGNTVTLTCIKGHRFFPRKLPAQDITCNDDHRWRPLRSKCEPINCPPIRKPENTTLTSEKTLFGTVLDVQCNTGHYFSDNDQAKNTECLENERWRGNPSTSFGPCKPIDCKTPPTITNGTMTPPPMTHYPAMVEYQCKPQHKFIDGYNVKNISCQPDGNYNETDLTCKIDRCDPVPMAKFVNASTRNTTWHTNVTYECEVGYEWTDGTKMRFSICQTTGLWTSTPKPCTIKRCKDFYDMPNALESTNENTFGTTVNYTCNTGYKYHEDNSTVKSRYCNEEPKWIPYSNMPSCKIVHCPPIMNVENATRDTNNTEYGTTVTIDCESGYQFPDKDRQKFIKCTENETWTDYPPACEVVYCPPIKEWRNYDLNSTENEFLSTVSYRCSDSNLQMFEDNSNSKSVPVNDTRITTCAVNKQWSPALINCIDREKLGSDIVDVAWEAESAKYVGTVAVTLLSIMVVAIILLDIQKLAQDFKIMRENVRSMMSHHRHRNRVSDSSSSLQRAASPPATEY